MRRGIGQVLILLLPLLLAFGVVRADAIGLAPALSEAAPDSVAAAPVRPVGPGELNIRTAAPAQALVEPARAAAARDAAEQPTLWDQCGHLGREQRCERSGVGCRLAGAGGRCLGRAPPNSLL